MERSLKYFLRGLICLWCGITFSCNQADSILYQKVISGPDSLSLSESLLNGAGTDFYYQGTVSERMVIHEGNRYDEGNAWGARELGVPYLKRGFAAEAQAYYEEAVKSDPEEWLGYKGYCWLYFYRDYEMALEELERFDAFTPGFVDYPQATSVDYMKGICHLQLGRTEVAIDLLEKNLQKEKDETGAAYTELMNYQMLAIAHFKNQAHEAADKIYQEGLEHNDNSADMWYHYAENLYMMNRTEQAKEALAESQSWYNKGSRNFRPYVEEFYAIYQEDIDALRGKLYAR